MGENRYSGLKSELDSDIEKIEDEVSLFLDTDDLSSKILKIKNLTQLNVFDKLSGGDSLKNEIKNEMEDSIEKIKLLSSYAFLLKEKLNLQDKVIKDLTLSKNEEIILNNSNDINLDDININNITKDVLLENNLEVIINNIYLKDEKIKDLILEKNILKESNIDNKKEINKLNIYINKLKNDNTKLWKTNNQIDDSLDNDLDLYKLLDLIENGKDINDENILLKKRINELESEKNEIKKTNESIRTLEELRENYNKLYKTYTILSKSRYALRKENIKALIENSNLKSILKSLNYNDLNFVGTDAEGLIKLVENFYQDK